MRRLIVVFSALVLVLSIFSVASASDKDLVMYRKDGNEKEWFTVEEDENNMTYYEITKVSQELFDLLGYYPKFEIDYKEQIVIYNLFKTRLEYPCIVDQRSQMVLLPEFEIPEEIVETNSLSQLIPNTEEYYNVVTLQFGGCSFERLEVFNKRLIIYLKEGFAVSTWDFYEQNGRYYVSGEAFCQMFYEIYY